jgi:putative transposase
MDSYAIELARYIALNPVRAGLVSRPSQWSWSSYKATIGRSPRPRFLSTDWVLEQFSSQKPESRKAFRRFVLDGIDAEAPWKDLRGGVILGGEEFVKTMEGRFRARKKTKGVSQRERFANRLTLEQIFAGKEKRPVCARTVLTAQLDHGYTLKSIADFLKVTPSTITRAVQNLKSRN